MCSRQSLLNYFFAARRRKGASRSGLARQDLQSEALFGWRTIDVSVPIVRRRPRVAPPNRGRTSPLVSHARYRPFPIRETVDICTLKFRRAISRAELCQGDFAHARKARARSHAFSLLGTFARRLAHRRISLALYDSTSEVEQSTVHPFTWIPFFPGR